MGEAKKREDAVRAAVNGHAPATAVQMPLLQAMVAMQLDLACHCLEGIKYMVANNLGAEGVALEMEKSIQHLQGCKARYIAAAAQKIVVAQPGDIPKLPR